MKKIKFTDKQINKIISLYKLGWSPMELGGMYNVSKPCITRLIKSNISDMGIGAELRQSRRAKKVKQTNLERYGVECVLGEGSKRDLINKTNIEKYGFSNPAKNKKIKEKIRQTNKLGRMAKLQRKPRRLI